MAVLRAATAPVPHADAGGRGRRTPSLRDPLPARALPRRRWSPTAWWNRWPATGSPCRAWRPPRLPGGSRDRLRRAVPRQCVISFVTPRPAGLGAGLVGVRGGVPAAGSGLPRTASRSPRARSRTRVFGLLRASILRRRDRRGRRHARRLRRGSAGRVRLGHPGADRAGQRLHLERAGAADPHRRHRRRPGPAGRPAAVQYLAADLGRAAFVVLPRGLPPLLVGALTFGLAMPATPLPYAARRRVASCSPS